MNGDNQIFFPPFTLDEVNHCLKRGDETILLRPKTLAVLSYLTKHPRQLVSKEELMAAVWAGAKGVDAALRVSLQELRKALGDQSNKPRYIETVGRKGWRFITPLSLRISESEEESFHPFADLGPAHRMSTFRVLARSTRLTLGFAHKQFLTFLNIHPVSFGPDFSFSD